MPGAKKDESLRKAERLRRKADFEIIAREGTRRHTRNFLLIARKNDQGFARVGVVAGKKVGTAVERNRVKRLVREFFRRNKDRVAPFDRLRDRREEGGARFAVCPRGDRIEHPVGTPEGGRSEALSRSPLRRPIWRDVVIGIIKAYKILVSPLFGPTCRFYPSCSTYASDAISIYGLGHGGLLAIKRLLKCHPFHPGGYDPIR